MRPIASFLYPFWPYLNADFCEAFGIFARLLDGKPGYESLARGAAGIELADSITGDAHKLLNVPYDCGFLFCRSGTGLSEQVFQNANAPYLKSQGTSSNAIRSPLNVGLENSRRFRGLPVYATLRAYGREGYRDMLIRQVELARAVAKFILHHDEFELLPKSAGTTDDTIGQKTFIIVLFKAKDDRLNQRLVKRINATKDMYCSETSWDGHPATRIAVSNWRADPFHVSIIEETLAKVLDEWKADLAKEGMSSPP